LQAANITIAYKTQCIPTTCHDMKLAAPGSPI
jgi:hypothetical protein